MPDTRVRAGMTAWSADGEKLGSIVRCDADSFLIEKGIFFPKDYLCRYEDIASVDGEDVRLSIVRDQLVRVDSDRERDEVAESGISAHVLGATDAPDGTSRAATHVDEEEEDEERAKLETRGFSTGFYARMPESKR